MKENKPIKVAHILNSVGGVDVHLRIILPEIDSTLVENIVIHGKEDTKIPFKDDKGKVLVEYNLPIKRSISPLKDIRCILSTIKILRREKPNLIHAHSSKGGIIARSAALFYPVTVLYTPHAFSYLSATSLFKRKVFLLLEQLFRHFHSVLLACSPSEKNRGVKDVGYAPERALLFSNSIKPIEEEQIETPEIDLPDEYICTVGRPSFQKNIEMMIEVLKKLKLKKPDIHLVIMGVGEYSPNKENVERLIKMYGLESNTTLISWIDRKQIFGIINGSKLYISTARYEGLPYSVIEAIALGKSTVVTDCDGNRDLVIDGYNGYVIQENSVDRMASRIFAILSDDALRETLEKNALKHFNENFNIDNNIDKLEQIYLSYAKK